MQPKKNPKYDIHRKRFLFFNISLVLSLVITTSAFEWKFPMKMDFDVEETKVFLEEMENLKNIQKRKPPKPATSNASEQSLQEENTTEEDEVIMSVYLDI